MHNTVSFYKRKFIKVYIFIKKTFVYCSEKSIVIFQHLFHLISICDPLLYSFVEPQMTYFDGTSAHPVHFASEVSIFDQTLKTTFNIKLQRQNQKTITYILTQKHLKYFVQQKQSNVKSVS